MKKGPYYYFAYGSNMNMAQMKQRCSNPKVLGIARLPGYKVEFYGHSPIWDGARETLIPDSQAEVWGVLYELSISNWESLDSHQDARFNGMGEYFHYPVKVIDSEQKTVEAILYKKNILNEAKSPSAEYLDFIVQGAREQGLPVDYLKRLRAKDTKPASYPVPLAGPSIFRTVSTACSDCDQ